MAGELAAEWIRIPDGNGNLQKVWIRDSTARRDIAQLQTDVSGLVIPDPSDASPQMDGTAAAGSSADYSRADHVHPSDTSKADAATTLAGYGITDAYTKTQVDGMIPSVPSAYTSNPEMDGTASPGSSTAWARGDHVHPSDTAKQDALTAAQLEAVNSGITAEKVASYEQVTSFTLTRSEQSYVNASSFARINCRKVSPHLAILHFNLLITGTLAQSSFALITIGSINNITLIGPHTETLVGQYASSTNSAPILLQVNANGTIQMYSANAVAGEWYRIEMPLVLA